MQIAKRNIRFLIKDGEHFSSTFNKIINSFFNKTDYIFQNNERSIIEKD
tara:strand:- start:376 stop:522 length:147 start_codon:yes stop_codon:yes gene_type:complete